MRLTCTPPTPPRLGVEEGDSVNVTSASGSLQAGVVIDPTLQPGVVYVPFNQPDTPSLGSGLGVVVRR